MKIDPTKEIMAPEGNALCPKTLVNRRSTKKKASPKHSIVKCQELKQGNKTVYSITEGLTCTVAVALSDALKQMPVPESPSDDPSVKPIVFEEMKKRYRLIQRLHNATGEIELNELERRYCEAALNHIGSMEECGFVAIYFEEQRNAK